MSSIRHPPWARARSRAALVGLCVTALVATPWGVAVAASSSTNPLTLPLYVDPNSWAVQVGKTSTDGTTASAANDLAAVPQARWVGPADTQARVKSYVDGATAAGRLPVLVAYAIPNRDCGGYSSGGFTTAAQYHDWVGSVLVSAIARRPAVVVVEPDALTGGDCGGGSSALSARLAELADAVDQLVATGSAAVYLDAGNEQWLTANEAAKRLRSAHVGRARGFTLNVSNFYTSTSEATYGEKVNSALGGGSHFVIDTSRNGAGPAAPSALSWCNPSGRVRGPLPGAGQARGGLDGFLWIKHPGESDGGCGRGEPASGTWFAAWANDFVERSKAFYASP